MASAVSSSPQIVAHHDDTLKAKREADEHFLSDAHLGLLRALQRQIGERSYRLSAQACPQCRTRFVEVEAGELLVPYCRRCRGYWIDGAQLESLTGLPNDFLAEDLTGRATAYPCPVCRQRLREQPFTNRSNLLVHVCPEGHGVYLEEGELRRILEDADRIDGLVGHLNEQHLRVWRELQTRLMNGDIEPAAWNCLDCGEPVYSLILDEQPIDYCIECQALWFDTHELQHLTGLASDVPGATLASRDTEHGCPRCAVHLRRYQFLPRINVTVEACPAGHGVFLRGGQLPRVLQVSEEAAGR